MIGDHGNIKLPPVDENFVDNLFQFLDNWDNVRALSCNGDKARRGHACMTNAKTFGKVSLQTIFDEAMHV